LERNDPHTPDPLACAACLYGKDLRNWTKHGSPFAGTEYEDNVGVQYKSATIVQEVKGGRPVAVKINGKYDLFVTAFHGPYDAEARTGRKLEPMWT